jgi:hypothetical protein
MLNCLAKETSTAFRRSLGLSQPGYRGRYTIANLADLITLACSERRALTPTRRPKPLPAARYGRERAYPATRDDTLRQPRYRYSE